MNPFTCTSDETSGIHFRHDEGRFRSSLPVPLHSRFLALSSSYVLMYAAPWWRCEEARENLELLVSWCDLCLPANEQAFAEAHRIKIQDFQVIDPLLTFH